MLRIRQRQPSFQGILHNGFAQRMLGTFFNGCRQPQHFFLRQGASAYRHDGCDGWFAAGDGAGFIQYYGGDAGRHFKRLAVFEQNAVFCAFPGAGHDGCRGRQPQRTGTGDNQNRDHPDHGANKIAGQPPPYAKRDNGNNDNGGHKNSGDAVRQRLDRRTASLRFLNQPDDLGQRRGFPHAHSPAFQQSMAVDGSPGNTVFAAFVHRHGFAAQHGFIHRGFSLQNYGVRGNAFSGAYDQNISDTNIRERCLGFDAVHQNAGCRWPQPHEFSDGPTRLSLGA